MNDAAKFQDSLIKITSKVGNVACPFGSAAIPLMVVLWFIFGQHSDMPFNTLPAWLINYNYWLSLLLQVTVCSAICQEYVVLGATKICFLLQLRMHFKHLKSNVQNILEVTEANEEIPWTYLQKKLKHLIDYHFSIIKIAEQVETLFNKCVLTGFIVLSVFICISMYAILSNPLFGPDFWRFIFYIFMTFMPFFADCFFSQQVITESEELFSSYCAIDFVGTDLRFQKALLVLLGQGQRTIGFTIGKFAPLSIITIVTVLKTAFSYLTFLQNMKGK
ncbi:odorant receptor 67a-like [Photinus pyralis]|uniref:odorant receptor 67a-like n=1 Tax=Photinus pyralis TaxID=7054 RepID=UPI001266F812|nr:odorant receptor 67a-like [Photinus pyralis]